MKQEQLVKSQMKREGIGNNTTWAAKAASTLNDRTKGGNMIQSFSESAKHPNSMISTTVVSSEISVQQKDAPPLHDEPNDGVPTSLEIVHSDGASDELSRRSISNHFSDWCTSQMLKINGVRDLTLIQFCLSIDSAAEVRETLAANLGSTPQVSQFASEFLRRKEESLNEIKTTYPRKMKK